jgi:hypothetical protein
MDENAHTIGLVNLLDEVSRDLDDFRKKHQSDYGVKNVTLWWDLEKERLLVRHAPSGVVRTAPGPRRRALERALRWLPAGLAALFVAQSALWFLTA